MAESLNTPTTVSASPLDEMTFATLFALPLMLVGL